MFLQRKMLLISICFLSLCFLLFRLLCESLHMPIHIFIWNQMNRAFIFLFFPSVVFFFGRVSSYSRLMPSQLKTASRKERKKDREREREGKRVNQTAGDVRPWRRTNSIHLGARDRIWWHNRNIWNRKSLALSFSLSFFCMLSQAVFYDSLDALLLSLSYARAL